MNIRFEYLYRDAGNFKRWGNVVFSNPNDIPVHSVASMVEKVLIDRTYFVATKAGVPDLHFDEYKEELDHGWHEAHALQPTEESPSDQRQRAIEEFVDALRFASAQ